MSAESSSRMDILTDTLRDLNISSDTSRSAARKSKKTQEEEPHMCVVCLHMFKSLKEISKHINTKHKANSKETCEEYQEACAEYDKDPECLVARHNKEISLLKVTMLEQFKKKTP